MVVLRCWLCSAQQILNEQLLITARTYASVLPSWNTIQCISPHREHNSFNRLEVKIEQENLISYLSPPALPFEKYSPGEKPCRVTYASRLMIDSFSLINTEIQSCSVIPIKLENFESFFNFFFIYSNP